MLIGLLFGVLALNGCTTTGTNRAEDASARGITGERAGAPEDTAQTADNVATSERVEPGAGSLFPSKSGKFTIQIGAYQERAGAERIAGIARGRLGMSSVEIWEDSKQRLFRIFVGRFQTKEEARNFRDDLILRYPGEYMDAWVNEFPEE